MSKKHPPSVKCGEGSGFIGEWPDQNNMRYMKKHVFVSAVSGRADGTSKTQGGWNVISVRVLNVAHVFLTSWVVPLHLGEIDVFS